MKIQLALMLLGLALVAAQVPTRTRSGAPPARAGIPPTVVKKGPPPQRVAARRRNDIKDVPDNFGRRAPIPPAQVVPGPSPPVAGGPPPPSGRRGPPPSSVQRGPPPPSMRRGPPPPSVQRGPPPPGRSRPAVLTNRAPPAPRVPARPLAPLTRTKSAGFLPGAAQYVPMDYPMYPTTVLPPTVPTQRYISYDIPDAKKEEEEEG